MFFLHAGDTEIGGFAISTPENPLYIEQFVPIDQTVTCVTVEFADGAVADYFDACVDAGLKPERFARIWCHTHPGESPEPSMTDEHTFARVFGPCDWSVMFIIGRTGLTYARLSFAAGPGADVLLPVSVDWSAWPQTVLDAPLNEQLAEWEKEYDTRIHPARFAGFETIGDVELGEQSDSVGASTAWWDYEEPAPPRRRSRGRGNDDGFDSAFIESEPAVRS